MKQVLHATNLSGIENLMKHRDNGNDYLCCSNIDCKGFLDRDVLFLIESEVIAEFYGDCGSAGNQNDEMSVRNTVWDEVHVSNDYTVEGLYWLEGKNAELYAAAYEYITSVFELPCPIYNAPKDVENEIKTFGSKYDTEEEFFEWLESLGIDNLIV